MIRRRQRSSMILMADDDPEDRMLVEEALTENHVACELRYVQDGQELLDYLRNQGKYAHTQDAPRPGVILLDLNMPRTDGREALRQIKSDPTLWRIPVIVFTTSRAQEDIERAYDLGVNSFITKPAAFNDLVEIMATIGKYWFDIVESPTV
jgi:CheY-like chemotaxis protein